MPDTPEKHYFNKLVRDKIPQIIESQAEKCEVRPMRDEEYKDLLRKKLVEETQEVFEATDGELIAELADVVQVVQSLAKAEGISLGDIEICRKSKEERLGGFDDRVFLVWSSRPKGTGAK